MTRFFFDVSKNGRCTYDLVGKRFPRIADACAHSELIAIDLSCGDTSRDGDWIVEVRTEAGDKAHAIPVPHLAEFSGP